MGIEGIEELKPNSEPGPVKGSDSPDIPTGDDTAVDEESNLVKHARRELELLGEEPDVIEWYLRVIGEFASFGHSGGSFAATLPVLIELLQFKNLKPLTDNPDEWNHISEDVAGEPGGLWQSARNSEAFSNDGGKTYWLLSEGANMGNQQPKHEAVKHGS